MTMHTNAAISDTYDDNGVRARRYPDAPTFAEIAAISDPELLAGMLRDIEDREISIKTQLEYLSGDEKMRNSRVNALIHWKISNKNIRARLALLRSSERRAAA